MSRPLHPILRGLLLVGIVVFGALYLARGNRVAPKKMREVVLKDDFAEMCLAIDNYTSDKKQLPRSVQDLLAAKYLHEVPTDPITMKKDWLLVFSDVRPSLDQESVRIVEVRSTSDKDGSNGAACKIR